MCHRFEAEGWGQTQLVKRSNEGNQAFNDRELAVYGLTIADAIKFTLTIVVGKPRALRSMR
jgi:hypothetical protein